MSKLSSFWQPDFFNFRLSLTMYQDRLIMLIPEKLPLIKNRKIKKRMTKKFKKGMQLITKPLLNNRNLLMKTDIFIIFKQLVFWSNCKNPIGIILTKRLILVSNLNVVESKSVNKIVSRNILIPVITSLIICASNVKSNVFICPRSP